jgi:hypothetical protein
MKKLIDKIRILFTKKKQKFVAYPRSCSVEELEKEIDKYGNENPNSHLGASYYARASLGLTELERRDSSFMGWATLIISCFALTFSIISLRYTAEQTEYTELQSRSDRITQLQRVQQSVNACKNDPNIINSGLFDTKNGKEMPCQEVLKIYKN